MSVKSSFSLSEKLLKNYNDGLDKNGVSGERLAYRLGEIAKIGLTDSFGSNRAGYSQEEKQAKDLISKWMKEAGLTVRQDEAGNVFGRLKGRNDGLPAIVSGSHVDSVPNGGHFDGPLGVLAALEVVEAWKTTGKELDKPFEVAIFSDEEGSRFNNGLNGSEAVIGKGHAEQKLHLKDAIGMSFEEVLNDVGLTVEDFNQAERSKEEIELFVELHIEQGKRLEKENLPCGIVTGIAGPCWLAFTFTGEAGHAGNTPMDDRKDALVAASEFILEVSKLPKQVSHSAVATVGKQEVKPNGVNVIAGEVVVFIDVRDIYKDTRDELVDKVFACGEEVANKHQVEITKEEMFRNAPVPIEEEKRQFLAESLEQNGIRPYELPSGAGHDAMAMGERWPVAMLFVRSKDGISHNPAEWSDLNDCVQAVHVLKSFIEKL